MMLVTSPHAVVNRVEADPTGVAKTIYVCVLGPDGEHIALELPPDQASRLAAELVVAVHTPPVEAA